MVYSGLRKKSGLKINLGLKTLVLLLCFLSISVNAQFADELDLSEDQRNGIIEVHYDAEIDSPYRERRTNWSFIFGVSQELFYPEKLKAADGTMYKDIFGKNDIKLNQFEVGAKYNFSLGSLFSTINSSLGGIKEASAANQATLDLTKNAISFGLILDTLFEEPYVAPYASVQTLFLHYTYIDPLTDFSIKSKTGITSGMRIGALIQLNWLDVPGVDLRAHKDWGLDNTFLDAYISQYNTTADKETPEFQTSYNYGFGIKLEF
jgi:hypothetical protein